MTPYQASYVALSVVIAALILTSMACSNATQKRAGTIVCSTAYRVSSADALTETDHLRFEDEDSTQSMPYIYLEVHAQYSTGRADGERSLRLWVTPTGAQDVLVSHLYQLRADRGPDNQYLGGHGFTGLNYAYDPASGAELQYWCEAD